MDHHIHIERFDDDHDHDHDHPPYTAYGSKESIDFDQESDQERLNRLSSTSTLVSGIPTTPLHHAYPLSPNHPSSYCANDIKLTSASSLRRRQSNRKSTTHSSAQTSKGTLWHRFMHSEAGRLVCSFVYFFVICIGMAFCNQLSDHRWVETGYTNVLLSDRGFDVIAAQADIQPANTFVMTSVVFTVLGIGMICPNWTMRGIVLRRILWIIGTLGAYRSMTVSVTTLPTPKEECRPSLKTGFWDMFIVALQMIPGTVEACTDDIFSGHTVFMVTCAIQWRLYCKNKWITYFSYLYISIGMYFVVATRLHYTVDVLLAIFITFAVWSIYISMIDVVMEEEYFGIKSHHEKYTVFDSATTEYEFAHDQDEAAEGDEEEMCITTTTTTTTTIINGNITKSTTISSRRRQLEHHMNRLRGPRIGYGRGEYDRVAFLPVQFNLWLKGMIRWCDGLDLRMNPPVLESPVSSSSSTTSSENSVSSRWDELVIKHRAERVSDAQSPCGCNKMDEQDMDAYDETGRRREMMQVYPHRDGTGLESNRVHDYSHQTGQYPQQQGRWRSIGLRTPSPRSFSPDPKEDKS
ncbi:hypothetical protein EDD11_009380 [Mortierella claussenii]|nr:hypothetical protein EDD11_009380 [Mortierella claussenii]